MKETNGKAKAARTVSRVQHQGERTVKTKRTIQRRRQEDERLRSTADGGVIFRADLPSCAVQPRNDTIVGWVTAHPARARRRVRAARTFISPEVASPPIYLYHRGGGIILINNAVILRHPAMKRLLVRAVYNMINFSDRTK